MNHVDEKYRTNYQDLLLKKRYICPNNQANHQDSFGELTFQDKNTELSQAYFRVIKPQSPKSHSSHQSMQDIMQVA
jgi:hypothetical protein